MLAFGYKESLDNLIKCNIIQEHNVKKAKIVHTSFALTVSLQIPLYLCWNQAPWSKSENQHFNRDNSQEKDWWFVDEVKYFFRNKTASFQK